ncbi:hypothetical protein AAFC00_001911 [Neodothiora populina]|uniref:PQ loop repeat protein n=1 Tax=Neodothiora populina TaxID=2781224 RepID=A0ABR3PQJ5_9PEZI
MATSTNPAIVFTTTQELDCGHLAVPNKFSFGLSVFLVAGILGSYLPQHYKIIHRASSAGLSPWWVLLGALSSIFAAASIFVLPTSQNDMACCRKISGIACAAALLGVIQVGMQWLCFTGIWALFLIFFPRKALTHPDEPHDPDMPKKSSAVIVAATTLITFLTVIILSTVFLLNSRDLLYSWANTLGIMASILSIVQYVPQLWTTWKLKHVYSLSLLTMMIQVPGSFVFAFSLWLRVGWHGWSTWLVYCVTGTLQAALLLMAFYFSRTNKVVGEDDVDEREDGDGEPTETDPLLSGSTSAGVAPVDGDRLAAVDGSASVRA